MKNIVRFKSGRYEIRKDLLATPDWLAAMLARAGVRARPDEIPLVCEAYDKVAPAAERLPSRLGVDDHPAILTRLGK